MSCRKRDTVTAKNILPKFADTFSQMLQLRILPSADSGNDSAVNI